VTISYFQDRARELGNLDSCESIPSHFGFPGGYSAAVPQDYLTEIRATLPVGRA